jgi:hypothetical protein
VGLGLLAPAAVPVELRTADRRVFRLSREVGDEAVRLERPAPFELGEPVDVRLVLPDTDGPLVLRAEVTAVGDDAEAEGTVGGCGLLLVEPSVEAKGALMAYVARRLGLLSRP